MSIKSNFNLAQTVLSDPAHYTTVLPPAFSAVIGDVNVSPLETVVRGIAEVGTPPTAAFTITPSTQVIETSVAFDGSSSTGTLSMWQWNFGDGSRIVTGEAVSHSFTKAGTYTVTLTVTDVDGASNSVTHTITITPYVGAVSLNVGSLSPTPYPEVAPITTKLPITDGDTVFISTDHSYESVWTDEDAITAQTLYSQALHTGSLASPGTYWRYSYAGVLGAHKIGSNLITLLHGENKNEMVMGTPTHVNTISGDTTCYSGTDGGVYSDCWADYFAFVSAEVNGVDQGPMCWPYGGYLTSGGALATNGLRNLSSFYDGTYIYLFYIDCTPGIDAIVVSRALAEELIILPPTGSAGIFQTWTGSAWVNSLPMGFTTAEPAGKAFFKVASPAHGAAILGNTGSYYFSVCELITGGYLGLEWGNQPGGSTVGTRRWTSPDLINWTQVGSAMWVTADFGSAVVGYPRPIYDNVALTTTQGTGAIEILSW